MKGNDIDFYIQENRATVLTYKKEDADETEMRTVTSTRLKTSKAGNLLLGGRDLKRDDYRTFRVDRIVTARLCGWTETQARLAFHWAAKRINHTAEFLGITYRVQE